MEDLRTDVAVGMDFGGTKILGALVDSEGRVLEQRRLATPHAGEELLDAMGDLVHGLEDTLGQKVAGLGVGAAGLVDREGVLHFGPNVGGITNIDLQGGMEKRLPGQQVRVENDANAAAWAECLFGAGQRRGEMAVVTLGTGVGCGVITNGRLFRGQNGFANEFGHMTIVTKGVLCACGKQGCWEAYASGRALGRLGRAAAEAGALDPILELSAGDPDSIRGEHVTQLARGGNHTAMGLMNEFAWWVSVGIANLISILDPEVVIIGGGLAEASDLYIDHVHHHLDDIVMGIHNRPEIPVVIASLGERAGAIGAAMLVHGEEIPEVSKKTVSVQLVNGEIDAVPQD